MNNLVERLRAVKDPLATEAADRIEELERQYENQATYDTIMTMIEGVKKLNDANTSILGLHSQQIKELANSHGQLNNMIHNITTEMQERDEELPLITEKLEIIELQIDGFNHRLTLITKE